MTTTNSRPIAASFYSPVGALGATVVLASRVSDEQESAQSVRLVKEPLCLKVDEYGRIVVDEKTESHVN